jgi:hypothetical protein
MLLDEGYLNGKNDVTKDLLTNHLQKKGKGRKIRFLRNKYYKGRNEK